MDLIVKAFEQIWYAMAQLIVNMLDYPMHMYSLVSTQPHSGSTSFLNSQVSKLVIFI